LVKVALSGLFIDARNQASNWDLVTKFDACHGGRNSGKTCAL